MLRRILIIDDGSGGTILANSLDRRRFEVAVLSSSTTHLLQPALLYVAFANARPRAVRDERSLLAHHVRLVHDTVTHVDLNDRFTTTTTTTTTGGGALGQSSPIIKCPPSPLEGILLTELLLRKRGLRDKTRLVFFTPCPRPYPAEPKSQVVEPILEERGIEVLTFFDVDRIDPTTRTIFSIESDQIDYDLPIIVPPFVGADIAYDPPDVVDQDHFVATDKLSLRVKGTDTAFAIGDAPSLPTSEAGVDAHLEAKAVARTLAERPDTFSGRTSCPFAMG